MVAPASTQAPSMAKPEPAVPDRDQQPGQPDRGREIQVFRPRQGQQPERHAKRHGRRDAGRRTSSTSSSPLSAASGRLSASVIAVRA